MKAVLTRYESTDMGTFGILVIDDKKYHTIEKPWINNEPFKSCIPEGIYNVSPFTRKNGEEVLALTGGTVSLTKNQNFERYAILIHAGNYVSDIVGCIAPGTGRAGGMVTNSRQAMREIMLMDITEIEIKFGQIYQ